MNVTPVASSALATVAYDNAERLLELEFRGRAIYRYFDVPATVHTALLQAPSKGKYFNQSIRGCFRYALAESAQAGKA